MEIVVHPQPLLGAHIQPPLPGTILYPTKDSAWHPVLTSIPPMAATEVPKESIIANTDFTTTSLIAKRRLSSKKRKKLEKQQQQNNGDPNAMDVSTHSPTDSTNSCSPSVTSTTFTPPALDKTDSLQRFPSQMGYKPITIPTTRTNGFTATTTMLHQHTHLAPPPHGHGVQFQPMAGGQYIPVCGASCYPVASTTAVGMMPKHFVNPVLNHLQRELNFRFLQEQRLQPAAFNVPYSTSIAGQMPHPQPLLENKGSETAGSVHSSEFKWCRAHVIIAKQIHEYQKQSKVMAPQPSEDGPHIVRPNHPDMAQQVPLMQMYNLQPNAALPGYMAMPYSLQEVQMRMQSFMQPAATAGGPPPLVTNTGISLVKQMARAPNQMAPDSNLNLQMVNGVQAPFPHSVPIATLAPSDYVFHGAPESWMAPVPVFGSCIVNPFQPGIMATSWVK